MKTVHGDNSKSQGHGRINFKTLTKLRRITYEQEEAPGLELEMPGIEVEDQAIL